MADPADERAAPSPSPALKRTPLYPQHLRAGARMVPFAGWEMPVQFSGVVDEHTAVRCAAGLFDVSHMGELWVSGAGSLELLQWLTPNDVSRLRAGRAQYNALLTEAGTFLDDLLVYCLAAERYLLVVNAGAIGGDLEWIREHAQRWPNVTIEDRSDDTALIAVQGPAASRILEPLVGPALDGLRYYSFTSCELAGFPVTLSRTGYTGEDGFEIYVEATSAVELWCRLLEAGSRLGLVPVGLGARDTLRLEAGMRLAGQDIDDQVTPFEAGLGWVVKLDKDSFVGREALERQRRVGLGCRLVGFELTERGIARHGHAVSGQGLRGTVTSGSWSPTLGRAIGIAKVEGDGTAKAEKTEKVNELDKLTPGAELEIEVRGRRIAGRVVELPFYRRPKI